MKWQYHLVTVHMPRERAEYGQADTTLNHQGADGWEAVSSWRDGAELLVLFKKPKVA